MASDWRTSGTLDDARGIPATVVQLAKLDEPEGTRTVSARFAALAVIEAWNQGATDQLPPDVPRERKLAANPYLHETDRKALILKVSGNETRSPATDQDPPDYPHTWTGRSRRYGKNLFLAFDQLANAVFGGDPDETISSRMGKWITLPRSTWRWRIAYVICRILHPIDRDHCRKSVEHDEGDGGTWA